MSAKRIRRPRNSNYFDTTNAWSQRDTSAKVSQFDTVGSRMGLRLVFDSRYKFHQIKRHLIGQML
jgi:hypothetical protein